MNNNFYTCPCCGYKSLESESPGSFEICSICYWEDDNVQYDDPHYEGGANEVSLYQAQRNFLEFGAANESYLQSVRKPTVEDIKDSNFQIIK
ncbi:hypothetical protein HF078_12560 [Bacillus sp. RO2]|uniref:CPCC family cysteine-rich protein n=1 Tax=Bacillus sp. RO2 TaxID=2723913 RepID=UPI00145E12FD|nr:CPCC family cysteine-rich protein [Bacillus sp. RO2]NMH73916.1 hypothetical protein [Bacillus sp. RO2]